VAQSIKIFLSLIRLEVFVVLEPAHRLKLFRQSVTKLYLSFIMFKEEEALRELILLDC
jgi:hypothetical protein